MSTIDQKGRITIPIAIRREATIGEGDAVVLRYAGPGVVVIETLDAIKDRIRAGNPEEAE